MSGFHSEDPGTAFGGRVGLGGGLGPSASRRDAIHLREQVALDLVLIQQFGTPERTDLDACLHEEAMRLGVKQQHCGPLETSAVPQPEALDDGFIGLVQSLRRQPLALDTPVPVVVEDPTIEVGERNARKGTRGMSSFGQSPRRSSATGDEFIERVRTS